MLKYVLALCLTALCTGALAQKVMRLNVAPGGLPPYFIIHKGQDPGGLVVELLRGIAAKAGYTVQVMEIPRNRVESMIQHDELDVSARAREWTAANPDEFLFTDPMLTYRDLVYSSLKEPLAYSAPDSLYGKRVGAVLGYVYPPLESSFKKKEILRVDVPNEKSLLAMLKLGRLDAAVVNEFTALWLIRNEGWSDDFTHGATEVESYPYRLMFGKKWLAFVQQFNHELAAMKKDGSLERLIQKYRADKSVPPL